METIYHLSNRLLTSMVYAAAAMLIIMAGGLLLGRLRGEQLLSVQTGSMRPLLKPGDAVMVRVTPARSLRTGEIISYRSPSNSGLIITHRLLAVDPESGWLTTKGDALSQPDPTFAPRLVVGRVVAVSPRLGVVLDSLRRPLGLIVAVYLPATMVLMSEIRRLAAHWPGSRYRLRSA